MATERTEKNRPELAGSSYTRTSSPDFHPLLPYLLPHLCPLTFDLRWLVCAMPVILSVVASRDRACWLCWPWGSLPPRLGSSHAAFRSSQVDPFWRSRLPTEWILDSVWGAVENADTSDRPRPRSLSDREVGAQQSPPGAKLQAAPPVLVFDSPGNLVRSWGGPARGTMP